jgi:hypothetical protein
MPHRKFPLSDAVLKEMFPEGTPITARMIAERTELDDVEKYEIIHQMSQEQKRPVGSREACSRESAAAVVARRHAFEEAHDILREQLIWANSKMICSKTRFAASVGERLIQAARYTHGMKDD